MTNLGKHYLVSGKVQGVFYRASTKKQAQLLKLTGWVKNLANGEVELKTFGERSQIEKLENWLWQGPTDAIVDHILTKEIPVENFQDFSIK